MKPNKQHYIAAMLGIAMLGATSCNDFLTIYPQDRVVEENFWEDKNDLEGVRYGAYKQMASTVKNLIIWGDIRSDAYYINPDYNSQMGDYYTYKKILDAELDSTMGFYDWGSVYTTINFCNKVLSHGEEVLAKDAQFTQTEWNQMKAEMTALRALNYFYLIRAFKDIPYSNQVINSDEDTHPFTTTRGIDVLDTLISDVRSVAGLGRNRFGGTYGTLDTKGQMTNTAIYALLAEMYLWRSALREGHGYSTDSIGSDADSVIFYAQRSLDALALQTQQTASSQFDRSQEKTNDYGSGLSNANLIQNEDMQNDFNAQSSVWIPSYEAIFLSGNSDESILELQFNSADQREFKTVNELYGHSSVSELCTSDQAFTNASKTGTTDTRLWYTCTKRTEDSGSQDELSDPFMLKWSRCSFLSDGSKVRTYHTSSYTYNNWIIYRMTDVMLMMAEAYAVKSEHGGTKATDTKKCRDIVDAIHKRSQLDQTTGLSATTDNTEQKCIDLVMKERLLELTGEGKRWFDLVRYAERFAGGHNPDPLEPQYTDGADGVTLIVDNYLAKGAYSRKASVLKNRIKNRYGLYSPYYYMELRANKYLFNQNPVWNREKAILAGE
ncbi:MAG: RagB/SusD family nutrient uptake outer membrane protein [Bacteroidaceae bacterium]|nr:RagB/SusD family nutrient uptake outer membrane protein [Bacteroidaceae bacterium]